MKVKHNGEWKSIRCWIKQAGGWKEAVPWVKFNGKWEKMLNVAFFSGINMSFNLTLSSISSLNTAKVSFYNVENVVDKDHTETKDFRLEVWKKTDVAATAFNYRADAKIYLGYDYTVNSATNISRILNSWDNNSAEVIIKKNGVATWTLSKSNGWSISQEVIQRYTSDEGNRLLVTLQKEGQQSLYEYVEQRSKAGENISVEINFPH